MPKQPLRSALVDHVMPDATEEEKAAASARWYRVLEILIRIADAHDPNCPHCSEESIPPALRKLLTEREVAAATEAPTPPSCKTPSWRSRLKKRD